MPRTRTNDTEEIIERPARPRRARAATSDSVTRSTARSRGATARTSDTARRSASVRSRAAASETTDEVQISRRKAPTTTIARKDKPTWHTYRMHIAAATLLVLGVGGSALVGFTDDGKIDVQAAVRAQEERTRAAAAAAAQAAGQEVAAVDDAPAAPPVVRPASLRPRGVGSPSAPPPGAAPASVATATTSVVAGTSTTSLEDGVAEFGDNESDISIEATEAAADTDTTSTPEAETSDASAE